MKTPLIAAALIAVFATPAMAGSRYGDGDGRYRDERDTTTDYAQVLSARPIYREVRVREPQRECWDEQVVYREDSYDRGSRYSSNAERTVGTVLGGVIGGAIGHQFSAGSGQQIATAIGAVVGADIARNRYDRDGYREPVRRERVAYEPRCRSYEQTRYEQRIDGYDVTYRYRGQVYNTQMPYDPGARLPVRVDVTPLR